MVVRAVGPGVDRPSFVTAHGPVVMVDSGAGRTAEVEIHRSTYLLATVEVDPHPEVLAAVPFAISSPVWVEVDGEPVCVEEDVRPEFGGLVGVWLWGRPLTWGFVV